MYWKHIPQTLISFSYPASSTCSPFSQLVLLLILCVCLCLCVCVCFIYVCVCCLYVYMCVYIYVYLCMCVFRGHSRKLNVLLWQFALLCFRQDPSLHLLCFDCIHSPHPSNSFQICSPRFHFMFCLSVCHSLPPPPPVQLVLLSYAWVWGYPQEHDKPWWATTLKKMASSSLSPMSYQ